jgi:hypothetical protein
MAAAPVSDPLGLLWGECCAIASRRSFELGNVADCLDEWRADLENGDALPALPDPTDLVVKCRYFESLGHGFPGPVTAAAADLHRRVSAYRRYANILSADTARVRTQAALEAEVDALNSRMQFYEATSEEIPSQIVRVVPSFFEGLTFRLLYRGSSDGFGANAFHSKCDGFEGKTVTFILTDEGYIFGGFTPLSWDSGGAFKGDANGEGFVFTLKNPYGLAEQKFPLRDNQRAKAICCRRSAGPIFGGYDIYIADQCNEDASSYSNWFGYSYENRTCIDGKTFFAGKQFFKVDEIEVFAVTE